MRTSIWRALVAAPTATVIAFTGSGGASATGPLPVPPVSSAAATGAWEWLPYEHGRSYQDTDVLNQINCLRAVAGAAPASGNTRLDVLALTAAQARAGRAVEPGSATAAEGAPGGGVHHGAVHSARYFVEGELEAVTEVPGLREQLTDPRISHVGIGRAYSPTMDEEGRWSEHLAVDLWEYPADSVVPGTVAAPAPDCPAHYVPPRNSPFIDVATTQQFYAEMTWLADRQISLGWDDGTYRPLQPVNRDAMAAFLYRAAGSPDYTPPKTSPFRDVPTDRPFYKEMSWVAEHGISTGWTEADGSRTYRPLQPVNRDAMAAFLYRLEDFRLHGLLDHTAPAVSPFKDVTTTQQFFAQMSWAAEHGISTGWDDGTYRALAPVNRDAMAAFLFRLNTHQYNSRYTF